jgi:phosphate transport system protein
VRRETLDENLTELHDLLGELASVVAHTYRAASASLIEGHPRVAERVIADDPKLDERRAQIEALAVETIGIFSPVGPDMRALVSEIQSAHELARVGNLARHVAEAALRRDPGKAVPECANALMAKMSEATGAMMDKAAEVLRTRNVILALELADDDDQVDDLHKQLFALMFGDEWTSDIPTAVNLTLLARFYERIADHAVALAERTVYLVTGQHPEALQL